ncbi:MAG: metallopeptidase TldD-related protein [Burkholderiaceae bacterium]
MSLSSETGFALLADALPAMCADDELLSASLSAEHSQFVRFNRAQIRQLSQVAQAKLSLNLSDGRRRASTTLTVADDPAQALVALRAALHELRLRLHALPSDPFLGMPAPVARSSRDDAGDDRDDPRIAARIAELASGDDFVGFLASGPIVRAVADNRGMRHWHRVRSSLLDFSLQGARGGHGPAAAVKSIVAGERWHEPSFITALAQARSHLPALLAEPRAIAPGRYRVYLGPMAVADLLAAMAWSGFSRRDRATGTSALSRLSEEAIRLSPAFTLAESPARGLAPAFTPEGHTRPGELALIDAGRPGAMLVSPRSAAEFGDPITADEGESPHAMIMNAGTLAPDQCLAALGDGLWIENIWYLNYSDRRASRVTGMSRFASFVVEGGRIAAPLAPMRFDDTLIHLFGDGLEAATTQTQVLPDGSTWGARSLDATRCPGILVSDMHFAL